MGSKQNQLSRMPKAVRRSARLAKTVDSTTTPTTDTLPTKTAKVPPRARPLKKTESTEASTGDSTSPALNGPMDAVMADAHMSTVLDAPTVDHPILGRESPEVEAHDTDLQYMGARDAFLHGAATDSGTGVQKSHEPKSPSPSYNSIDEPMVNEPTTPTKSSNKAAAGSKTVSTPVMDVYKTLKASGKLAELAELLALNDDATAATASQASETTSDQSRRPKRSTRSNQIIELDDDNDSGSRRPTLHEDKELNLDSISLYSPSDDEAGDNNDWLDDMEMPDSPPAKQPVKRPVGRPRKLPVIPAKTKKVSAPSTKTVVREESSESEGEDDDEDVGGTKADLSIEYRIKVGNAATTKTLPVSYSYSSVADELARVYDCRTEKLDVGYTFSYDAVKTVPARLDSNAVLLNLIKGYKSRVEKEEEKVKATHEKLKRAWQRDKLSGKSVGPRPRKGTPTPVFVNIVNLAEPPKTGRTTDDDKKKGRGKGKNQAQWTKTGTDAEHDTGDGAEETSVLRMAKGLQRIRQANTCNSHGGKFHAIARNGVHVEYNDPDQSIWTHALIMGIDGVTEKIPPAALKLDERALQALPGPDGIMVSSSLPRGARPQTKAADIAAAAAERALQMANPPPWWNPYPWQTPSLQAAGPPGPLAPAPVTQDDVVPVMDLVYPKLESWLPQVEDSPARNPDGRNLVQYLPGLLMACEYLRINEVADKTSEELLKTFNGMRDHMPDLPLMTPGVATIITKYSTADCKSHLKDARRSGL